MDEKIKQQASVLQGNNKLEQAAALLDQQCGTKSVSQFVESLRNNSPSKKTRAKHKCN